MQNSRRISYVTPFGAITRRRISYALGIGAVISVVGVVQLTGEQRSVTVAEAMQFIQQSGDRLIEILNGPDDTSVKMRRCEVLIAEALDVGGVARFALGRFWNLANDEQRNEFVRLFPAVLVGSIGRSIGSYQGLRFTVDRGVQVDHNVQVWTTVLRAGEPPRRVTWLIGAVGGAPKILDIVAEGASMRITERDDCASFLAQNNHSIPDLIETLRRQAAAT